MKRFIKFAFALSFVLYMTQAGSYAQGHGSSHGPSVSGPGQGHGPEISHDKDHGRDADHDRTDVNKSGKDTKGDANFEERIERNPQLKANLTGLLPPNTDLKTAAMGFKNQGQFIAALHVSKNLNIPFADLKAKMTGDHPESLGKAIHDLKPAIAPPDAQKEA